MSWRAVRITSRIVFFVCGIITLLTAAPFALLRGIDLPVQSEWVTFVAALGIVGILCVVAAVMPRAKLAKWGETDPNDKRLFSTPLKTMCILAVISYGIALLAFFAPHTWRLNPQVMLALCPLYFVRMAVDPSPVEIFFLLAPINAAVYGALGIVLAYVWLAFSTRKSN